MCETNIVFTHAMAVISTVINETEQHFQLNFPHRHQGITSPKLILGKSKHISSKVTDMT